MKLEKTLLLLLLFTSIISAQERFSVSGIIKDASNGETLFGASVFLKGTTIGVLSNEYGFYSITAPKGNYTFVISYMGYADVVQKIELTASQKLDAELTENSTQLDEVVISSSESEKSNMSCVCSKLYHCITFLISLAYTLSSS